MRERVSDGEKEITRKKERHSEYVHVCICREKHTKETVRVREKQRLSERETLQESTGKYNYASNGELLYS